jgi:hypothetical protein
MAKRINTGENGSIDIHVDAGKIVDNQDGSKDLFLNGQDAVDLINILKSQNRPKVDIAHDGLALNSYLFNDEAALQTKFSWEDTYLGTIAMNSTFGSSLYGDKIDIYVAMETFRRDAMMRRVIELMVQFSLDKIRLEGSTKKIREFFDSWINQIDIYQVLQWFFMEYYKTANVTILKQKLPFKSTKNFDSKIFLNLANKTDGDIIQKRKDKEDPEVVIFKDYANNYEKDIAQHKIPYRYTVVDPRLVTNNMANGLAWGEVKYYPEAEVITKINEKNKDRGPAKNLLKGMPLDFIQDIRTGKNEIILSPSFACQFFRLKQPYEKYGLPLSATAMNHLQFKNKLRDMDLSVIDAVKNKILKVTIGDKDFPATAPALRKISSTLQNPSQVLTILWNHTLKMEWIEPNFTDLKQDKYEPVDKDIRIAFGITPVLLGDTQGQNYSTAFVSMKAFIENLNDGLRAAEKFLNNEFLEIGAAMGFDSVPSAKIFSVNLTDTMKLVQLAQAASDRGILSNQTVCEIMGYDWPTQLQQLKEESALRQDGIISVKSPNTISKNEDEKTVEEKQNTLKKNSEGNPTPQVQERERKEKPRLNDGGSVINAHELFRLKHIGKIIYNRLVEHFEPINKKIGYKDIAKYMAVFPTSALSFVGTDFNKIDFASLDELVNNNKDAINLLNIEVDILLSRFQNLKNISHEKASELISEAWAIYHTKIKSTA